MRGIRAAACYLCSHEQDRQAARLRPAALPPGETGVRFVRRTPDGRKIWEVRRNGVVETHVTSRKSVEVIERTAKRFERVLKRLAER